MYVIIWEFQLNNSAEKEFTGAYGSQGIWTSFFKKGEGYVRTELLHDTVKPHRYVTIDYWLSKEAYETFRAQYADEYKAIDLKCELLTVHEAHLGSFIIK